MALNSVSVMIRPATVHPAQNHIGACKMKRILTVIAISALVTGCASTTPTPTDPYSVARQKYAPWEPVSIAKIDGTVYLAAPSSKKQVAPGVYRIWTKSSRHLNITELTVVDCNSEQTAISQIVRFNDQGRADKPIKIDSEFSKPIFSTVGYGIIEYICK